MLKRNGIQKTHQYKSDLLRNLKKLWGFVIFFHIPAFYNIFKTNILYQKVDVLSKFGVSCSYLCMAEEPPRGSYAISL